MTSEQARILDKVRKLLAVAGDDRGNEQERDTAMRQAYRLLAKHNLDIADARAVGDNVDPREDHHADDLDYPWVKDIYQSVAGLFFCEYYFARDWLRAKRCRHHFVGRASNAITAKELAQHVVKSVFTEMRKVTGGTTNAASRAFAIGAVRKLVQRIRAIKAAQQQEEAQVSDGRALVLASLYDTEKHANEAWMADKGYNITIAKDRQQGVDRSQAAAFAAGVALGGKIGLSPSINGGPNKKAPALK